MQNKKLKMLQGLRGSVMINKNALYTKIWSELHPLWEELDKIETELKNIFKFEFVEGGVATDHEIKLDEKAVTLRREIAWWESELEEVS